MSNVRNTPIPPNGYGFRKSPVTLYYRDNDVQFQLISIDCKYKYNGYGFRKSPVTLYYRDNDVQFQLISIDCKYKCKGALHLVAL